MLDAPKPALPLTRRISARLGVASRSISADAICGGYGYWLYGNDADVLITTDMSLDPNQSEGAGQVC